MLFYQPTNDLSVVSTETKYIKLKTKTQNNIVIFGIFHKKIYYYFGFSWNNLTKKPVFTKKSAVLVIGFLVFWYFKDVMDKSFNA